MLNFGTAHRVKRVVGQLHDMKRAKITGLAAIFNETRACPTLAPLRRV